MQIGNRTVHVGNKPVKIDVAADLTNGRAIVPLRFVCDALNIKFVYEKTTKQIYIFKNPLPEGFAWNGDWYNTTNIFYSELQAGQTKKIASVNGFDVLESVKFGPDKKFIKTEKGLLLYVKSTTTTN